ncbi:MAG TPA: cell wall hydrolase, partial [Desulfobacteria bacterium]|nr:cell wall hydrolase [Desulfobacteria bacterium]
ALGLSYEDMMSINGYNDIWIYPGQEIVIPDVKKVTLYKVQEGETLSDIAKKFSVIKNAIYGHGVSDGKLVEGQVLVIPEDAAKAANMQVKADAGVKLENASNLDLLARAIYAEARGEVYEGKVAVGAVILNRLSDPAFPKTIRDIIFQPRAFTAVDDGQINLVPDEEAYRAAREAMRGADPSLGAVYYWNPEIATSDWIWSRPIIKQIGKHVFAR